MRFDALSFVLGILLVIVVNYIMKRRSGYTVPTFAPPMTAEQAGQLYQTTLDQINQDLQTQSQAAIQAGNTAQAKQLGLQAQEAQMKLSLDYNKYLVSITPDHLPIPSK